ncbi:hypothetical protein FCH28_24280 [Streptomyces piniterrae]|uniref:Uncharacterized protein n=1 Tax=Streptomyces piniterrae TaxID=2571125 RepID=A0A4U0N6M1_9ACTN|nr:hypothetical protein [Streptomyces piniterrae]TJZ49439.1 hypothetical protein FCH28_24280 [Streptomyces piniterrae]
MAETIAELAGRLIGSDAGGWSQDGARALVAGLGWSWTDTAAGPVIGTGRATGEARLRPVGSMEQRYAGGEAYVELAVPVGPAEPDAASQAAAFRAAREELTAALGEASVIGVYGDVGPFYDSGQLWGSPYLRWRDRPSMLELRAGRTGPELILQPSDPVENCFWRQGVGEEYSITGFFGSRNDTSNVGLGFPGGWYARSWETVTGALADFLDTLPAEMAALGTSVSMPFYGQLAKGGAPILFGVNCGERLSLCCFDEDIDGAALGWGTVAEHPATRSAWPEDDDPRWRFDAGGPGEPSGRALAEMLVASARAVGVATPADLVLGGEAEYLGPYHVTFYGLGLKTG